MFEVVGLGHLANPEIGHLEFLRRQLRFSLTVPGNFISAHVHDTFQRHNTMDHPFDKTAVETIDLLEARLKRIEYAICGHLDSTAVSNAEDSAYKRLGDLEHSLHQLASKSKVVQDLLRLRELFSEKVLVTILI